MKPIKFDLPLNGTRIATLDDLKNNLTAEILEPFRSGKLAKWLRVRKLDEQAEKIDALLIANNEREVQLLKSLCEVFISAINENDAREMIEDYKTSSSKNSQAEEIEQLKAELARKEVEIAQLKITKEPPASEINQLGDSKKLSASEIANNDLSAGIASMFGF